MEVGLQGLYDKNKTDLYLLDRVLSSTSPPSLLGSADSRATKSKSLLDALEAPLAPQKPTPRAGTSIARNQWLIGLLVITLAAAAMFYLVQPFQPHVFTPPVNVNGQPLAVASPEHTPNNAIPHDETANTLTKEKAAPLAEQDVSFDVVTRTSARIEQVTETPDDIDMAFASLEAAAPQAHITPKPVSKPANPVKPNVVAKPKRQEKAVSQKETKRTVKADKTDVAIISALLNSHHDDEASVAPITAKKTPPPAKQAALKEPDFERKALEQPSGAMDISMMSTDPAARALEKCSSKNFIQKPYCEWRACSEFRGKSPLCAKDQPEPERPSETDTTDEPLSDKTSKATTELSDTMMQEAKTMATDKTKEKAKSTVNKQFNSIFGGESK